MSDIYLSIIIRNKEKNRKIISIEKYRNNFNKIFCIISLK